MLSLLGSLLSWLLGLFAGSTRKDEIALGKAQERNASQAAVIKDVEVRNAVDRSVAAEPDPADELRRKWSRD
jgi:membrane protein YqaA with SNARE-associated domain